MFSYRASIRLRRTLHRPGESHVLEDLINPATITRSEVFVGVRLNLAFLRGSIGRGENLKYSTSGDEADTDECQNPDLFVY